MCKRLGILFILIAASTKAFGALGAWYHYEDPFVGLTAKILVFEELSYLEAQEACHSLGEGWGLPTLRDFGQGGIGRTSMDPKTWRFMERIGRETLRPTTREFYLFWTAYDLGSSHAAAVWSGVSVYFAGIFADEVAKANRIGVVCTWHPEEATE